MLQWAKLFQRWCDDQHLEDLDRHDALAGTSRPRRRFVQEDGANHRIAALLDHLLPHPPALLLNYLSEALEWQLTSTRCFLKHLLYAIQRELPPVSTLSSIATIVLAQPSGLDASTPLPSSLTEPAIASRPGPSEPSSKTNWTLHLLMPLLRQCTNADQPPPAPLTALLAQILSITAPYPAPPFDVGLEASQLMPLLPDVLSMPLREALSGLMTDLAISESTAQLQVTTNTANNAGGPPQAASQTAVAGSQDVEMSKQDDHPAISAFTDPPPKTVTPSRMISLLLAAARSRRTHRRTGDLEANDPKPEPDPDLVNIIRLCSASDWCESGEIALTSLLESAMEQTIAAGDLQGVTPEAVRTRQVWVEEIPLVLKWWKHQGDLKMAYPVSRQGGLS